MSNTVQAEGSVVGADFVSAPFFCVIKGYTTLEVRDHVLSQ